MTEESALLITVPAAEPAVAGYRLTELVAARLPSAQPHGGQYAEVIPHLTVADGAPLTDLLAAEASVRPRWPRSRWPSTFQLAAAFPRKRFVRDSRACRYPSTR